MAASPTPYRVGVLGATGVVGQHFVALLAAHPWFRVAAVAASDRSAGKTYLEATGGWLLDHIAELPAPVAELTVVACDPEALRQKCDLVFSALDASAALEIEPRFARAGIPVFSNAGAFRQNPGVPICVPYVNPDHLAVVREQPEFAAAGGFIATNPNCCCAGISVALAPLRPLASFEGIYIATLQAVSGAGLPGVPSLRILGNAIPHIEGEEAKISLELSKIFGRVSGGRIEHDDSVRASASCHRVPVLNGHLVSVSIPLKNFSVPGVGACQTEAEQEALLVRVREAFLQSAAGSALLKECPSAPASPIALSADPSGPQPARDVNRGRGMTVTVGKIRVDALALKFSLVVNNTVLGAAGGSILNAEHAHCIGLLKRREGRETS